MGVWGGGGGNLASTQSEYDIFAMTHDPAGLSENWLLGWPFLWLVLLKIFRFYIINNSLVSMVLLGVQLLYVINWLAYVILFVQL